MTEYPFTGDRDLFRGAVAAPEEPELATDCIVGEIGEDVTAQ